MYKIINFREIGDSRGSLIPIEAKKDVPFDVKRLYYIYNTNKDVVRGKHAHLNLEQVLIPINGSCSLRLDDGVRKEDILLNDRTKGIYIASNIWREMYNFSPDCVLLVLASEYYNEKDYIRDYDEFKKRVRENEWDGKER